ncbi:hypothetical protein Tsubulata_038919 [Turnera subulata]|uniref:Uncharacterized protein n=1 Tax=Turnera subulata TaxID=218843 RepID=A0A9Q0G5Z3_9ROSI|nr:hypothetical protein Tsubulata_038919 [Turnera subulata]
MITRSKLVEQLREYQIRSQHKCRALTIFSPKPHISSWADVAVAIFWTLVFKTSTVTEEGQKIVVTFVDVNLLPQKVFEPCSFALRVFINFESRDS